MALCICIVTGVTASLCIFSVSDVAQHLVELVTDETKNGEALMVMPGGKQYVTFPSFV